MIEQLPDRQMEPPPGTRFTESQTILWIGDRYGELYYASPEVGRFIGRGPLAETAVRWLSLVVEEDRVALRRAYAEARAASQSVDTCYRLAPSGDDVRWMHEIAHPVRDDDGHVVAFVAVSRDISRNVEQASVARLSLEERRRREVAERREAWARLVAALATKLLLAESAEAIALAVVDSLVPEYASWATLAELAPTARVLHSAGGGAAAVAAAAGECFDIPVHEGGRYELRLQWRGESNDRASASALQEIVGYATLALRNLRLVEVLREENAARRRDAEALAMQEARYRLAASSISDTVFDYDVVRDQIEFSRDVGDIASIRQGVLGRAREVWGEQVHPDDLQSAIVTLERCLRGETDRYVSEYRMQRTGGGYATVSFVGCVLRDASEVVVRLVGTVRDVTELRESEARAALERASLEDLVEERTQELSEATAELTRAARLKDEFLANMSHELRTPLNAILGLTESLSEGVYGPLAEQQSVSLSDIHTAGSHLLSLINDLLDLSKVDAGRMQPRLEPTSVATVVESTLRIIRPLATKAGLTLSHSVEPVARVLETDAQLLVQVLTNLLSNAVKFTESGGAVALDVQVDEAQSTVTFAVRDSGIGIASENLGGLFSPFHQLDAGLSRRYGGTGLGLALSHRLTRLLGGRILVDSTVGVGSTFSVVLPWPSVGAAASFAIARRRTPTSLSDPLILIIEDNEANLRTFSGFLMAKGFRVASARDGLAGLELVGRLQPDACVVDIQLPELDGLSVIRRIRATPRGATIPLVVLTALAMTHTRQACLNAGADEYLTKPVRLQTLRVVLDSLLRRELPTIR